MEREAMEIPRAILSRRDLTHGEKTTITAIYLYAYSGKLIAFPSNQTLATDTAQAARSIQRHLSRFESLGLISRGHDGVKRIIYLAEVTTTPGSLRPRAHTEPTTDQSPPTTDQSPPSDSRVTPPRPTGASLHLGNQPKNQPIEAICRPKGQPLSANNAQLFPDEPAEEAQPSTREQWVNARWATFTHLHRQVQDRLIATGAAKRHSKFPFRPAYKRMLGTLYREKYTADDLFGAWVEMAKDAEDQQSLKYFRPSTCFVAKNINRSLEDRVNDDAQDPQEIAEVADPG